MSGMQSELFYWAAHQSAATGAAILGAGLVYAFFGFRLFGLLLVVTCAGLGWLGGAALAPAVEVPAWLTGCGGAVLLGALSAKWPKPAVSLASAATWGLLSSYLVGQLGWPGLAALIAGGLGGGLGLLFSLLCYRTMTVVLTTIQGAVLLVVGWVALSTQLAPAVGHTFREWAHGQVLLVPVFLVMLFAAGYSYQAMHRQGDIKSGA